MNYLPRSCFGLVSVVYIASLSSGNGQFKIIPCDEPGKFDILDSGQRIATYAYQDKQVRRPYFANVMAANGIQVTRNFPPQKDMDPVDHATIHPGIWMAFGDINGGDFWRNEALIRHERFVKSPYVSEGMVCFTTEHSYVHGEQILCVEQARVEIHSQPDGYLFYFDSTFHAKKKTDFGDQQEMGLGIRLATPLCVEGGTGRIVNSKGQINEKQGWGQQADWCDYSGVIDGHRTGAMLMPHPDNFRLSRFHSRDYGFTAANPFADKDFEAGEENHTIIPVGEKLRVRFGLLIYSRPNIDALDQQEVYQDFVKTTRTLDKPAG